MLLMDICNYRISIIDFYAMFTNMNSMDGTNEQW